MSDQYAAVIEMNQRFFYFILENFLLPQPPFMSPAVITYCFPGSFFCLYVTEPLLSSIRWETTQLFLWMAAMFLFCFLLTLLSSFILFLFMSRQGSHLQIIYGLKFSCWSSITLFLLHILIISFLCLKFIRSIPMFLGKNSKSLIIANKVL